MTYISVVSDKLAGRCDQTLEEGKHVFIYVLREMSFNKLGDNFMALADLKLWAPTIVGNNICFIDICVSLLVFLSQKRNVCYCLNTCYVYSIENKFISMHFKDLYSLDLWKIHLKKSYSVGILTKLLVHSNSIKLGIKEPQPLLVKTKFSQEKSSCSFILCDKEIIRERLEKPVKTIELLHFNYIFSITL